MIKIKSAIMAVILLLSTCSLLAQSKQSAINHFVDTPGLKHALVGICVKDFSGKTIAAYNSNKSLTPASTMKIVTTATALELMGDDFKYQTTLFKNGNELYIVGSGDPTLGTKYFENDQEAFLKQWTDAIYKAFKGEKIKTIFVVDEFFGYEGVSSRWTRQDVGNYYAAGAYGISVFDNTYELFFNTTQKDSAPKIMKTDPEMKDIVFTNTLTLNTTGRDNGYIIGEPFSNRRLLTGNIPSGKTLFSIKGDIPDPGLYLGERIKESLVEKGMTVGTVLTTRNNFENHRYSLPRRIRSLGESIYTHYSFPLGDIVQNINFKSNNHFSEHLIRTLGRLKNSDQYSSALDEGVEKIQDFWKDKDIDTDALFMYDGCGLAPSNAVSPQLLCDILVYMQTESKYSDIFLKSLPQAGKEGTVRSLAKGTRLVGKLYAKSGSIANVRCYAGYYISGNTKYAFSIMVNNYTGSSTQLTKDIEKLMLGLF